MAMISGPDWVVNSIVNGSVSDGHSQFGTTMPMARLIAGCDRPKTEPPHRLQWASPGVPVGSGSYHVTGTEVLLAQTSAIWYWFCRSMYGSVLTSQLQCQCLWKRLLSDSGKAP